MRMIAGAKTRLADVSRYLAGTPNQWAADRLADKAVAEWLLRTLTPSSQPTDAVTGYASVDALFAAVKPTGTASSNQPLPQPPPPSDPSTLQPGTGRVPTRAKAVGAVVVVAVVAGVYVLFRRGA